MLAEAKYLADEGIAGIVYLADRLGKPIIVEGPAGTESDNQLGVYVQLLSQRLQLSPVQEIDIAHACGAALQVRSRSPVRGGGRYDNVARPL